MHYKIQNVTYVNFLFLTRTVNECVENLMQFSEDAAIALPSTDSCTNTQKQLKNRKDEHILSGLETLQIAYHQPADTDRGDFAGPHVTKDDNTNADVLIELDEEIPVDMHPTSSTTASNGAIPKASPAISRPLSMAAALKTNLSTSFPSPTALQQPPICIVKQPKLTASQLQNKAQQTRIAENIQRGYRLMILMRGAPGCGKSHLSREIVDRSLRGANYRDFIFSSDDYFYNNAGQYRYDPHRIPDAHEFNQRQVVLRCQQGWSPIIVDNTNIRAWEMFPYVAAAVRDGYLLEIVEPATPWARSAHQLSLRNVHQVPKFKLEKMLYNYEPVTVSALMAAWNLKYATVVPTKRNFPRYEEKKAAEPQRNKEMVDVLATKEMIDKAKPDLPEPIWSTTWSVTDDKGKTELVTNTKPMKDQRTTKNNTFIVNDDFEMAAQQIRSKMVATADNQWTPFEQGDFWQENVGAFSASPMPPPQLAQQTQEAIVTGANSHQPGDNFFHLI